VLGGGAGRRGRQGQQGRGQDERKPSHGVAPSATAVSKGAARRRPTSCATAAGAGHAPAR
jgi:hypothetical protein